MLLITFGDLRPEMRGIVLKCKMYGNQNLYLDFRNNPCSPVANDIP